MDRLMYERMLGVLHRQRTWLEVTDHDREVIMPTTKRRKTKIHVLVLSAKRRHGRYRKGQVWQIPLTEISDVMDKMAAEDPSFRIRCANGCLSSEDVNEIIRRATKGAVSPDLRPIHNSTNNSLNQDTNVA